jgi:HNH endonuclease
MRTEIPDGDLAAVIERAVTEKLERLEARRFAKAKTPRKALPLLLAGGSRYIPADVRRRVHKRDGGRCAFVDELGRRCSEDRRLEYHHRHPYAIGGRHDVANISLLCSAHNRHMAERDFGRSAISRRRPVSSSPSP